MEPRLTDTLPPFSELTDDLWTEVLNFVIKFRLQVGFGQEILPDINGGHLSLVR